MSRIRSAFEELASRGIPRGAERIFSEVAGHADGSVRIGQREDAQMVSGTMPAPTPRRGLVIAAAAFMAVSAAGFALASLIRPAADIGASGGPSVQINSDPLVLQAPEAAAPQFEMPPTGVEIPLRPMTSFVAKDASYIRSFIADAETTIAVGEIGESSHRVFIVTGPAIEGLADTALDGSRVTCIIDTVGNSGSCLKGGAAVTFGLAEGWGDDGGLDFRVLKGSVPDTTSVIVVTTSSGTFWQIPRGGVGFLALPVPSDQQIEIQFLDAAGVSLGSGDNGSG